jgi:transposase
MSVSYFAGIDVSKPYLDVHILPSRTAERFANAPAGHRQMIKLLREFDVCLVVLEATGGYERPAVVAMVNAGLRVHVAQPQVIHAFGVSLKQRAQNDKIDAATCARYAQDRHQDLLVIDTIDKTQQALQALVVRRGQLVEMQTMEQNRVQQVHDKQALKSVERSLKALKKEIARIEKQIDAIIHADATLKAKAQKLQETKGVGPQTTRTLLAYLPELGKVSVKRLNSLVGVAPYASDSGDKKFIRHITGGRAIVRNGLYMACLSAISTNPVIQPYYQKLVERGLAHKTAMMACIRKLLAYLDKQVRLALQPATP